MPRYPYGDDWRYFGDTRINPNNCRVECKLVNDTKYTWYWEDFRLQEWTNIRPGPDGYNQVKKEIRPGETTELHFITQRYMGGLEAWVTYNTGAGPLEFHWNVPLVGSNSYHTYKLPAEFISVHNSAPVNTSTTTSDTSQDWKYGRRIDGDHPRFEWTIKQRDPVIALSTGQRMRDHLYTVDPNGENSSQFGYAHNGICGYVYPSQYPDTVPLYRFYHAGLGDHFYTQSSNAEGATDWKFERIECYLPSSRDNGATILYRWFGHGNHFYTLDPQGEAAVPQGYTREGDAGFVYPTQVEGTVPLHRWYIQRD